MKFVYPNSDWASNIGNPFFNLGMEFVIRKSASLADVPIEIFPTASNPQKSFKLKGKYLSNIFNYSTCIEGCDAVVLAGPLFDLSFRELFEPILKKAKENNVKVLIVSSGGIRYHEQEIEACRSLLKKYPPFLLTTRDRDTYLNYKDLATYSYDGICGAWFVPDYYKGYPTPSLEKYVTLTFDHALEPKVDLSNFDLAITDSYNNIKLSNVEHGTFQKIKRITQRNLPTHINDYFVIRPNHCTLNRPNWRLAFKPNTFISQTPYGYLNLYKNTQLTLTDRLHASVVTLAYGNPARLIIKSSRVKLLERVKGASDVTNKVTKIDLDWLNKEKTNYVAWLTNVFKELPK